MKQFIREFLKRGLWAAWGGPVVIAVINFILDQCGVITVVTIPEMCRIIASSTLMAFIAGGINAIYQTDRLPLIIRILVHCAVLYLDYILVYLLNGWLKSQLLPILVFTGIFWAGFALVWFIIYLFTRKEIDQINHRRQIDV